MLDSKNGKLKSEILNILTPIIIIAAIISLIWDSIKKKKEKKGNIKK